MILKKSVISIIKTLEQKKIEHKAIILKKIILKKKSVMQLNLLKKYKYDYINQFNNYVKIGFPGVKWKNYIKFIKMLEMGIIYQKKIIIKYENELKNDFSDWNYLYCKLQGWQSLLLKKNREEYQKKIESEEINIEELSILKFLKNRSIKI